MRWPFVSRALFEHVSAQLKASDDERRMLLQRLCAAPTRVEPVPEPEKPAESVPFTTPIDRVLVRFDQAPISDKQRFKARMR